MTKLLNRVFQEVARLPEAAWDERFRRSQDKLSRLAKAAREEIARGDLLDEDPGSAGPR